MKLKTIFTYYAFALLTSYNLSAQTLQDGLKKYEHLLGTFEVEVMMPTRDGGWTKGGEGKATFETILGGKFIQEKIKTTFGQGTLTMHNTIGIDPRESAFRLFAMDREYGSMDMYKGRAEGNDLIFDNLDSDKRFQSPTGESLAFRLNFVYISATEHHLLVEYTKDDGTTWYPYAKNIYKKI